MTRRRTTIALPDGPALVYVGSWQADGTRRVTPVDREAVQDPRERALYRALAGRADQLADSADQAEPERPFGFTLTTDTTRTGD